MRDEPRAARGRRPAPAGEGRARRRAARSAAARAARRRGELHGQGRGRRAFRRPRGARRGVAARRGAGPARRRGRRRAEGRRRAREFRQFGDRARAGARLKDELRGAARRSAKHWRRVPRSGRRRPRRRSPTRAARPRTPAASRRPAVCSRREREAKRSKSRSWKSSSRRRATPPATPSAASADACGDRESIAAKRADASPRRRQFRRVPAALTGSARRRDRARGARRGADGQRLDVVSPRRTRDAWCAARGSYPSTPGCDDRGTLADDGLTARMLVDCSQKAMSGAPSLNSAVRWRRRSLRSRRAHALELAGFNRGHRAPPSTILPSPRSDAEREIAFGAATAPFASSSCAGSALNDV